MTHSSRKAFTLLVLEGGLIGIGQQTLPGLTLLLNAVGFLAQTRDRDHGHVLVDVPDCEAGEASHGSVDCAGGQVRAHFSVVAVGGDSPDHVGGVDVFEAAVNV